MEEIVIKTENENIKINKTCKEKQTKNSDDMMIFIVISENRRNGL